ncbi:hypothetical protein LTR05_005728 [Lithohypha guttulata]|uniref:Uncharacterized protein n=1 Tax=Lithohypha guttulata TaxID=1690604 RepID=A0AAN7SY81_9EURO|nr:hypothetical protein LTR05_005728 [Lithohypha guttulata]
MGVQNCFGALLIVTEFQLFRLYQYLKGLGSNYAPKLSREAYNPAEAIEAPRKGSASTTPKTQLSHQPRRPSPLRQHVVQEPDQDIEFMSKLTRDHPLGKVLPAHGSISQPLYSIQSRSCVQAASSDPYAATGNSLALSQSIRKRDVGTRYDSQISAEAEESSIVDDDEDTITLLAADPATTSSHLDDAIEGDLFEVEKIIKR